MLENKIDGHREWKNSKKMYLIQITDFGDVMPYNLLDIYRSFGRTSSLHLQG
jgi:hypothetical protein